MDAKRLSRRDFLRMSALTAAGAVLAGCGPAPTPETVVEKVVETVVVEKEGETVVETRIVEVTAEPPAPAVKEITTWNIGTGTEQFQLETLRLFNDEHPGMKVNYDPAVAGLEYGSEGMQKLRVALVNQAAPDFVGDAQVGAGLVDLVSTGEILDISEAYKEFGWDQVLAQTWIDWATVEGKQYALPSEVHHSGIFYNKEIFAELGLEVPRTWAAYLDVFQKCQDAGYIPYAVGLGGGWPADYMAVNYMYGAGGDELIECFKGEKAWTGCDACLTGLANLDEVFVNYSNPDINGLNHDQAGELFLGGKAAMQYWHSSWNGIQDAEFDWGFFVVPVYNADQYWSGVGGLGGSFIAAAHSMYPEVVFEFWNWWFAEETAVRTYLQTNNIVTFPFTPPGDMEPKLAALYEEVMKFAPTAGETNTDWMPPDPALELRPLVQGMAGGELTPAEVLEGMQEKWESWLAEQ